MKRVTVMLSIIFALLFVNNIFAQSGEALFKANCATCHKATTEKSIGPGLSNVDDKHSDEWLNKWIKDSQGLIKSGDKDAVKIFEAYNKIPMPSYSQFSDAEIQSIVDFLDSGDAATSAVVVGPASTSSSSTNSNGSNRNLLFWLVSALLTIIGVVLYKRKNGHDTSVVDVQFEEPHAIKNYPLLLLGYLALAGLIIAGLVFGLKSNFLGFRHFFFAIFPFVSIALLFVGGLYRYGQRGYKVSSLSTQFLEGKQLFWGSQPFHWGLSVLFFGHLTALLFPSSVLAWNGSPVRLMILEVTAFIFGLSALLGIILLIKRRITSRSLLVVTNKMDMVVYTILLTQIISGLSVAYYVRWGSSWFSSILTPYLRSIFSFNPDISAVSTSPVLVQIHIISAFLLIAIIPFTRFMHFLVAPFDYSWRRYQQVIWNWNKDVIRNSKRHTFGRKPRNH